MRVADYAVREKAIVSTISSTYSDDKYYQRFIFRLKGLRARLENLSDPDNLQSKMDTLDVKRFEKLLQAVLDEGALVTGNLKGDENFSRLGSSNRSITEKLVQCINRLKSMKGNLIVAENGGSTIEMDRRLLLDRCLELASISIETSQTRKSSRELQVESDLESLSMFLQFVRESVTDLKMLADDVTLS